ncbi:MAG: DUF4827 domain-containing protein [Muribaculaceae bacterium]|nr:DUF4827 domain-containing protein [Muribaculaceae bacterium]
MNMIRHMLRILVAIAVATVALTGCKDRKSYAEMLKDETRSVNFFLSGCQVIGQVPADSVFVSVDSLMRAYPDMSREDALRIAPYYRLDEEGDVYMQVVSDGTLGRVTDDQLVYFRFNRANLNYYYSDREWVVEGNSSDLGTDPTSFKYNNYTLESSYKWGSGLQMPLRFLQLGCNVNLVVKSQVGLQQEQSSVIPWLYTDLRYYPSRS